MSEMNKSATSNDLEFKTAVSNIGKYFKYKWSLMKKAGISQEQRAVVAPALQLEEKTGLPAAAMELPDGRIITGKTSNLLGASSALLLNALKALADLPDELHLISPQAIDPIQHLKVDHLGNRNPRLHTNEVLIALSISAATDPTAEKAMEQLSKLRGCDVHSSVILSPWMRRPSSAWV